MTDNNQNSKRIDTCIVPLCPRQLKKRTEYFQGGRISDVSFLTLKEAAIMASRHAGIQITSRDFIRSAELGEIELFISLRRPAKMFPINRGEQTATVIHYQKNELIKIPFRACQDFLATGFGSWDVRYELNLEKPYQRYMATHALDAGEPAIEVIEANCRVLGHWVHALADNFLKQATPAPQQSSEPAPVVADSASTDDIPDPERRLARLRELGGNARKKNGEWKFRGISVLVASEKTKGRKRSDEKTIRIDLKEAAQNQLESERAGFGNGLGQR